MVCSLLFSYKPPSGEKVGGYVNVVSREGMAPNDVINADASATLEKNILERFSVSPDLREPASRIAPRQSLQRGKPATNSTIAGQHDAN